MFDPDFVASPENQKRLRLALAKKAPAKFLLPAGLYRHPAVKAYLAGAPLDSAALVGRVLSVKAHEALELGLRRRYNATQIAHGVPTEGFVGLEGVRDDRA